MKARRFSIAKAMAVTALLAVDLAWLRAVLFGSESVVGFDNLAKGRIFDFGLFGMFNLLALGLLRMSSRERDKRSFLVGFEVVGLLTMLVYWGFCCKFGAWCLPVPSLRTGWGLLDVAKATNKIVRVMGIDRTSIASTIGFNPFVYAVYTVVLTAPQLLAAMLGGSLVRRAANRGEGSSEEQA